MPREPNLFRRTKGSPVDALLVYGFIPPRNWIVRARQSRKAREKDVARILRENELSGIDKLREWEERYRVENFYEACYELSQLKRGRTRRRKK